MCRREHTRPTVTALQPHAHPTCASPPATSLPHRSFVSLLPFAHTAPRVTLAPYPFAGLLAHLKVLNLHGNRLRGPLPSTLTSLGLLEHLDLSRNTLTGPLPFGYAKRRARQTTLPIRHARSSLCTLFHWHITPPALTPHPPHRAAAYTLMRLYAQACQVLNAAAQPPHRAERANRTAAVLHEPPCFPRTVKQLRTECPIC